MIAQNNPVKMLVNFNRGIFVPLVGQHQEPTNVYNYLKDKGARLSLEHVRSLMNGTEELFKDFEVVALTGYHSNLTKAEAPAPVVRRPAMAIPSGQQSTKLTSPVAVARGRGREYPPSGNVLPLKRGTTYAHLMEMLMIGATMNELLAATSNATAGGVNDVLSWQIKHRGYGLRFDQLTGKYFIVLPHGHSALMYKD